MTGTMLISKPSSAKSLSSSHTKVNSSRVTARIRLAVNFGSPSAISNCQHCRRLLFCLSRQDDMGLIGECFNRFELQDSGCFLLVLSLLLLSLSLSLFLSPSLLCSFSLPLCFALGSRCLRDLWVLTACCNCTASLLPQSPLIRLIHHDITHARWVVSACSLQLSFSLATRALAFLVASSVNWPYTAAVTTWLKRNTVRNMYGSQSHM